MLRYLFANLINEEIFRDQQIRRHLLSKAQQQKLERENAPTSIQLPGAQSNGWHESSAPPTASTLKPVNGTSLFTPGLSIGQATPGGFFGSPVKTREHVQNGVSGSEDGAALTKTASQQSGQGRKSSDNKDYFSTAPTNAAGLTSPTETGKPPLTPGGEVPAEDGDAATALPGDTPSKFGRKFKMGMSFNMKKLTRTSTIEASKPAAVEEAKETDTDSDAHSVKTSNSRTVDENFFGCVQKIRFAYEDDITAQIQRQAAMAAAGGALGAAKDLELPSQITPSLPSETPVLKPPLNTTILIQEERPDAGGVQDLWEGKVGKTGEATQVDLLESRSPMWLGDCLLRNQIPLKDVVKISFVLEPWKGELPSIAAEGNNRLNANRMLRARKILSYVSERIEPASDLSNNPTNPAAAPAPAPAPTPASAPVAADAPSLPTNTTSPTSPTSPFSSNNPYARYVSPPNEDNPFASPDDPEEAAVATTPALAPAPAGPPAPLKPEDYLELYCNGQLIPPKMTLATIRAHVWKSGGDVVLMYKANGRKQILHAPQQGQPQANGGSIKGDDVSASVPGVTS